MHDCPIEGCFVQCPQHRLMCGRHWYWVPKKLQGVVYRVWNDGSPYYLKVRQAAIDAVMNHAGRSQ